MKHFKILAVVISSVLVLFSALSFAGTLDDVKKRVLFRSGLMKGCLVFQWLMKTECGRGLMSIPPVPFPALCSAHPTNSNLLP